MTTVTKKSTLNLVTNSVLYNVVARKNNLDKNKAVKYYAKVKNSGLMTEDDLESQLEQMSSLTIGDVKNVVANLQAEILKALSKGNVVKFGEIGSFSIGASSKGTDTSKEFTAAKITKGHVNFKAGSAMREMVDGLKFTKLNADGSTTDSGSTTGGSTTGGSTTGGSTSGGSTSGGSTSGGSTSGGSTSGSGSEIQP